jgi:aarF domain-containing kinase
MLEHSPEHACENPTAFEEGVQRIVQGVGLGARGAFNLKALKIGDVLLELTTLVRVHRVKVEPNFTTLVTAIVVLEGLGRQLDPTLDLFAVALPLLL